MCHVTMGGVTRCVMLLKAEHLSSVTSPFFTNMLLVLTSIFASSTSNFCLTTYLLLTLSCGLILILLHCG